MAMGGSLLAGVEAAAVGCHWACLLTSADCCVAFVCLTVLRLCCCQLGLRTLSVGLANNLLMNLPEPFKRTTFAAAAASAPGPAAPAQQQGEADAAITATPAPTRAAQGRSKAPTVPAGMAVAPWSVVALATLLQRCGGRV